MSCQASECVAGAKWSREILSRVLIEAYDNGDMPIHEALAAADGILGRNALEFYKLEGRGGFSASTDSLSKLNAAATAGYAASVASMERTSSFQPRLPPSLRTLPQSKSIKLDSQSQLASPRAPKVDPLLDEKVIDPIAVAEKDIHEGVAVKHVRLLFSDGSGQRRCRVSVVLVSNPKTIRSSYRFCHICTFDLKLSERIFMGVFYLE